MIALVLVTLAVVLLTHRVWRNWQQRWRPPAAPDPHAVRLAVEPPTVVDSLSQRRARHLDALSSGVPRNAIVACWLDLEESVRASGIPADPALTSAELTQRVLISLDVDPQPVLDLARLYREARFSTHDLGEHHRESAVRAVQQFHADLAGHPVSATRLTSDGRS